jgi:hypothetical protein
MPHFWLEKEEVEMKSQKKIEIGLEAFLIIATLIGVVALVSAVQKASDGTTVPAVNGTNSKN